MTDQQRSQSLNRAIWLAFAVSVISLVLFLAGQASTGDASIALWLITLIVLFFVSLPLHGWLLTVAIMRFFQSDTNSPRGLYVYLLLAAIGYTVVAANYGAFDGVTRDTKDVIRELNNPAQVTLEKTIARGPVSSIADVMEALANGADPNAAIFDNRMPLLVVVASRTDVESVKALLDAGADPNKRSSMEHVVKRGPDLQNPSALEVALHSEYGNIATVVELLVAAGADLAVANNLGQYPLDVAIANEHYDAALVIAKAGGEASQKATIDSVLQNASQDESAQALKEYYLSR